MLVSCIQNLLTKLFSYKRQSLLFLEVELVYHTNVCYCSISLENILPATLCVEIINIAVLLFQYLSVVSIRCLVCLVWHNITILRKIILLLLFISSCHRHCRFHCHHLQY